MMEQLFAALLQNGWIKEGDALFAPGRSVHLEMNSGYPNDVARFLDDMLSRRQRLSRARELCSDYETMMKDVESAISAIEKMAP